MSNFEYRISNVEVGCGVMHSERFPKADDPLRNLTFGPPIIIGPKFKLEKKGSIDVY